MPYKPTGDPLPLNIFPPQAGPDQRVNMGAFQRFQYSPQDPAAARGLGLPQQYTTSQPSDGDPDVLRQAYADQEARLGPMRLPSETSDDGLGLLSTPQALPVSSGGDGGSDFNWLTAIGAGLQSAGAAHFGNYGVAQGYVQMRQQADMRKQMFAQQQAQLEEQKKQHAFQQVTTVLANKDMSESQKASLLEGFAKGENPMIANFARTAIDGIGKKRMSRIGLYMDRYPTQMQKLADGMMKGDITADDIDARLGLIDEIEKHNAKLTGEMELESEIKANPHAPVGAKAWLAERESKRMKEQAEANITNQTQSAAIENISLKPQMAKAELAERQRPREVASGVLNDQGQVFNDIFNPKTGQTERIVGTPLQRTQEVPASVTSRAMNTIDSVKNMKGTIDTLRSLLVMPDGKMRDDLVGAVGGLKGLVYGAAAQADAFAQLLRGGASRIDAHISDTKSDVPKSAFFDPSLSKADLLQNILAYQLAMVHSDGGVVSNADFKEASRSLGGSKLLTGAADIIERLNTLEDMGTQRAKIAQDRLSERGVQQQKHTTPDGQPKKFDSIEEYKKHYGLE